MNMERTGGGSERSLEERITNEIRKEAAGLSDRYVQANYEDAASLFRFAANRYDELTSQEKKTEGHSREITRAETQLREREAAWKAWSDLAEERNQAADLAEERRLEALERNDGAGRQPSANGPLDKDRPGATARGAGQRLVATEYAPTPAMRDKEQVAIYGGEHALLIATTGPVDERASHDRALKLVNDPDFKRIVSAAYPETKDAIGKGTYIEGLGGDSRFPDRMAALARDGAADRPDVVLFGPVAQGMTLAKDLADSKSVQAGMAPASQDRARGPGKDFREMSQAERLQDRSTNAGAKVIAALDAAIDRKYGEATPQAERMKQAARESVAQTLEGGQQVSIPRVRDADWQREAGAEQVRTNDRSDRGRDR